jgi:hypothetical protein
VIGADGSLTGNGGGLRRKEWLLKHEGHCWCERPHTGNPGSEHFPGRSGGPFNNVKQRVHLAMNNRTNNPK